MPGLKMNNPKNTNSMIRKFRELQYQVRDAVVTLNEGQGHRTEEKIYRPWLGFSSNKPDGHCLNSF